MDDTTKILVALGASAAANCRPCMDHHEKRARENGLSSADVRIALELGTKVSEGAQKKTREYVRGLVDAPETENATDNAGCC
jgi:AhpD family alkylhydroperoxidase